MQADKIAGSQKLVQADIAYTVSLQLCLRSTAVGQHPAAEGSGKLRHSAANRTGADYAEGLAKKLKAYQPILRSCLTAACITGNDVADNADSQAEGQLCYRIGGIACSVAHCNSALTAGSQRNMVYTGKGYRQHFQIRAGVDNLRTQRLISQHDNIGLLHTCQQLRLVGVLLSIIYKIMTCSLQRCCQCINQLHLYA